MSGTTLNRKVFRDGNFDSLMALSGVRIPSYPNIQSIPISPRGSLAYDETNQSVCYSDGLNWNQLTTGTTTLPPPIQSIANLTTNSGDMIYTTAPDTYTILNTSSLGRGWLGLLTVNDQRTALGLIIGTTIQAHSNILDSLISNSNSTNQILYSNGSGYSLTPSQTFGRSLLNISSAGNLASLIDSITGNISTVNTITTVSGLDSIQETGISIDSNNNISGILDLNLIGNLDGITPQERLQLANIDSNIISSNNWSNLSNLNQNVSTTSTPTFLGLNSNNQNIINVLNPVNAQDAATKNYVDSIASSGAPPLASVNYATTGILTLSPLYSSISQTLTATIAGVLVVDSNNPMVGNRILIKDQVDQRENGVYIVTDDGSSPGPFYILTRSSDFNQSSMPKVAGTSVFVQIIPGTTNGGTSWALSSTVTIINPLTDNVSFVQTGGGQQYTAGQGINNISLAGGSIAIENTPRFTYSGNELELSTVTVPFGGTGLTTLTSGNVMVGNGVGNVDVSKPSPVGDFVGTTDSQTLTNKTLVNFTNNIISRGLFSDLGANTINTFSSSSPSSGYVLTATSSSSADWLPSSFQSPDRELNVYQGAPDISPNFSTLGNAITQAILMTPTSSNWINITIYPGTYSESIPLIVPSFISITSASDQGGAVIITPSTGVASEIFRLLGNTRITGIIADGLTTSTIGFRVETGSVSSIDLCQNCSAQNVTNSGFYVRGNGTQFSRIFVCRVTTSRCFSGSMNSGYSVSNGGVLAGLDFNATGFAGFGTMTYGYIIQDDFSLMDSNVVAASFCNTGIIVGPGSSSLIQANYPRIRLVGVNVGSCFQVGMLMEVRSVARVSDFRVDEFLFQVPIHIQINNPNSGNPNLLVGLWTNVRIDKFIINGNGGSVNPQVIGSNLSEVPNEATINVSGRLAVGLPSFGFRSVFGEGDFTTTGILSFYYDVSSGSSTNLTTSITTVTPFNVFPSPPEANDAFYISNLATTGIFSGIRVNVVTAIVSTNGVTTDVVWEYWNGVSWSSLNLMSTLGNSPYSTKTNVTFGQGDAIGSGTVYVYRFFPSNWLSTLAGPAGITLPIGVTDAPRYYIRARVVNTGTISVIPQLTFVRIGYNMLNVNSTGFTENLGSGETQRNTLIPSSNFLQTGVAGETAPSSQSLTFATTNTIRATVPNTIFNDSTTTTCIVEFRAPFNVDTSRGIDVYIRFAKSVGNTGNIAIQVDCSLVKVGDAIGNPNGGSTGIVVSSGIVAIPSGSSARVYSTQFIANLNVTRYNPTTDQLWIKLYRFGSDASDTYNNTIYISDLDLRYYIWN